MTVPLAVTSGVPATVAALPSPTAKEPTTAFQWSDLSCKKATHTTHAPSILQRALLRVQSSKHAANASRHAPKAQTGRLEHSVACTRKVRYLWHAKLTCLTVSALALAHCRKSCSPGSDPAGGTSSRTISTPSTAVSPANSIASLRLPA